MPHKEEILRYLGVPHCDKALEEMVLCAEHELTAVIRPRHVAKRFSITVETSGVTFGKVKLESRDLAAHLQGCGSAFLFACTLGFEVDALIRRYSLTDMAFTAVLQACAAQYTEEYADKAQREIEEYAQQENLYLRPRYSPGYGDFPLSYQRFFFDVLNIPQKIGVTLNDQFMMVPFKSVTAVIGLSPDPSLCHIGKCMTCAAENCPFRKELPHA